MHRNNEMVFERQKLSPEPNDELQICVTECTFVDQLTKLMLQDTTL